MVASLTDNAVILTDAQGRIEWVNEGFTRITEFTLEEARGRKPGSFLQGPETDPATVEVMRRAFQAGEGFKVDVLNYSKSGRKYWLAIEARPIRDADGRITHFMAVETDLTDRKAAEAEVRWALQRAEEASRAKSEFLSRMSHELRTPLNAVLGFAQLLEMSGPTERQRRQLDQIVKGGRHLLNLINEVLDISRIEAGRLDLSLEPVNIRRAVEEAADLVRPLIAQRQLTLTLEPNSDDATVLADQQRFKQVLLNLLSNAAKYNRERGQISVRWQEQGETHFRIAVRDTGRGIPPEHWPRLFTPFDRLGAESSGIEGSGLGLVLSKRIVEAMNGELSFQSEVGQGTEFSVVLPRVADPNQRPRLSHHDILRPVVSESVCNVLYIEDNLANVALLEGILAFRPGVRLLTAMQGHLGLELARQHHPDLILLDVHLPDIPGDEVLRRLRDEPRLAEIPSSSSAPMRRPDSSSGCCPPARGTIFRSRSKSARFSTCSTAISLQPGVES
jgi:PAS domain S-box-containing protein